MLMHDNKQAQMFKGHKNAIKAKALKRQPHLLLLGLRYSHKKRLEIFYMASWTSAVSNRH